MKRSVLVSVLSLAGALCCTPAPGPSPSTDGGPARVQVPPTEKAPEDLVPVPSADSGFRVAHVVVALCDNVHQGIIPVKAALGDGDDLKGNLYWGALYGVKTFFSKKVGWTLLKAEKNPAADILERIVFHTKIEREGVEEDVFVVADAWRGRRIREAIGSFLEMSAGRKVEQVAVSHEGEEVLLVAGGGAQVVAYVGHDGLMEFDLPSPMAVTGAQPRGAIVLACVSKSYFREHLRSAGAGPLLLTTGLMAPEAYTLDAALRAYFSGESPAEIREAAAGAYARYQPCGLAAARHLFWAE